jgi:class 3 adenylate cyclase
MFCDLVGSTELSVRLDPEDLREVIVAYQTYVAETVARFGGFVAKYMGDGMLVYFGYPRAHEHDAEHAIRAGLALVRALNERDWPSNIVAQIRVGIATGLVVVGDLGVAQEHGIVGETPNLAARLQALAEPNTVVIASSTRRLTGGLFDYRDLGAMALKGFVEDVQAWQVTGPSTAESRFEALREAGVAPLLGRDEELELLLRRWKQAKSGEGRVVLLSGEPGIGKSRLAAALLGQIAGEPHLHLRYFCSPHHADSALHPIIGQFEHAANIGREDSAETRLDKLVALFESHLADSQQEVALFADLLGIDGGKRYPALDLSPRVRMERTLAALLSQLVSLSARQPVLVTLEDAHWIDPSSHEAMQQAIERLRTLPVLLVVTARPEFQPNWVGLSHVTLQTLDRLSRRERTLLIEHLTAGKPLPEQVLQQIVERSDGCRCLSRS